MAPVWELFGVLVGGGLGSVDEEDGAVLDEEELGGGVDEEDELGGGGVGELDVDDGPGAVESGTSVS